MLTIVLVVLLLVLLFGGLGYFIAEVFLLGLLIALLVGVVMSMGRRGSRL